MLQVVGLSHLVFTSQSSGLPEGSILSSIYQFGERNDYGPIPEKKELLRDADGWESTSMSLYHSKTSEHPSLELIHIDKASHRPAGSYGLILPPGHESSTAMAPSQCGIPVPDIAANSIVSEESLPVTIAFSPKPVEHGCSMGAWLDVADLDASTAFFTDALGAECISKGVSSTLLKCRVVNKKFSKFLWLLRQKNSIEEVYYNDDLGLSTIGWVARGLDGVEAAARRHGLRASGRFEVGVGGRTLRAAFLYDNRSASHEILSVQ